MLPSRSGSELGTTQSLALPMVESSQVGDARRLAAALAFQLGFDETETGKLALIVTEAANNLVKHAQEGTLLLRALEDGETRGIEVLALDRGPGMVNLAGCRRDGYSTGGTSGTGLGAMDRLSGEFEIYSVPQQGTALMARLWVPAAVPEPELEIGAVCVPCQGEEVCGDAWAVAHAHRRHVVLIADGLGHGPLAAEASQEATRVFRAHAHLSPAEILQLLHPALRPTRGAAVAVASLDLDLQTLRFAGVGNIAGVIVAGPVSRSLVSYNGTVGLTVHKVHEFTYPFPEGALLLMHSDGLTSSWKLDAHRELTDVHPALIAGVLYRDHKRGRDDVTVVAARPPTPDDTAA